MNPLFAPLLGFVSKAGSLCLFPTIVSGYIKLEQVSPDTRIGAASSTLLIGFCCAPETCFFLRFRNTVSSLILIQRFPGDFQLFFQKTDPFVLMRDDPFDILQLFRGENLVLLQSEHPEVERMIPFNP